MFAVEKFKVKGDAYEIAKKMVKAQGNAKFMDSGAYGSVYGAKGSNVVYKIGNADDNEGYLAFIKVLAKQKTQNPFLPKVYGLRFIKDNEGDHYFVVAMERLKELPRGMGHVCDWFEDELRGSSSGGGTAEKMLGVKKSMPKPLKEALDVLRKAYKEGGSYVDWDLHRGNFMMRNKQIVVTDPLA